MPSTARRRRVDLWSAAGEELGKVSAEDSTESTFGCRSTYGPSAGTDGDGERRRAAGRRGGVLRRAELQQSSLDVGGARVHARRARARRSAGTRDRGKLLRFVVLSNHVESLRDFL